MKKTSCNLSGQGKPRRLERERKREIVRYRGENKWETKRKLTQIGWFEGVGGVQYSPWQHLTFKGEAKLGKVVSLSHLKGSDI